MTFHRWSPTACREVWISDDQVDLSHNYLDFDDGSQNLIDLKTLQANGVNVLKSNTVKAVVTVSFL